MKLVLLLTLLWASVLKAEQLGYSHAPRGAEGRFKIDLLNDYVKTMRIGMDFAIIFQNLDHGNSALDLAGLNAGFQNSTCNLNLDTELVDGLTTYIELYLSSEHHTEMYMKEGYLLVEKLPMFDLPWLNSIMKYTTIKAGQMEVNFGDWHFRRSDNADVSRNPLIGNAIIDTNTTETGVELMFDIADLELMVAASNGSIKEDFNAEHGLATYAKLAYDGNMGDMRLRLSGSFYKVDHGKNSSSKSKTTLYSGNRSGARYQSLLGAETDSGQVKPRISQDVEAYMLNLLWQYNGLELFGLYENAKDKNNDGNTAGTPEEEWAQYLMGLKYNLTDNFYVAGRYNVAEHKKDEGVTSKEKVNRTQLGLGYKLTETVLIKGEWIKQKYKNITAYGDKTSASTYCSTSSSGGTPNASSPNDCAVGAEFDGWSIEGSVSF